MDRVKKVTLTALFLVALCGVFAVFWFLPSLGGAECWDGGTKKPEFTAETPCETAGFEWRELSFPKNLAELKVFVRKVDVYTEKNMSAVTGIFVAVYIFLQAFAIPGALILSLMSGALFTLPVGLTLVTACSLTGSTICYLMSYYLGSDLVMEYAPDKLAVFRKKVRENRHNLFWYYLFLRLTPLLPNWFINVSSPILDVGLLHPFMTATFLGLLPQNYLHWMTGHTLEQLGSDASSFDWGSIGFLLCLAGLSLLPTWFTKKVGDEKSDNTEAGSAATQGDDASGEVNLEDVPLIKKDKEQNPDHHQLKKRKGHRRKRTAKAD